MPGRKMLATLMLVLGFGALAGGELLGAQDAGRIDIVEIEGLIDPPVARYLTARLQGSAGAQAVIVRLDTPGSIRIDERSLLAAVADAPAPVVAWVAPRGATARAMGAELTRAADASFRAQQTSIEDATEIDGSPASSLSDLLQSMDGMTLDGSTIESWDEERGFPGVLLRFHELPLWDRLLHAVTTPEAALFLVLLGIFGLIFEVYNPGIGIAALLGAGSLGLGFYALNILPTNWIALVVMIGGIAALVYDLHIAGFGIWTVLGLGSLAAGAWILFPGGDPALDVGAVTIVGALVLTLVFFVSVMTAALRVRLRRPIADSEGIIGAIAEAQTDIAPEGTVLTNGALWRARTMETGIAAGARVEVKATEGLVLLVEPLHEE